MEAASTRSGNVPAVTAPPMDPFTAGELFLRCASSRPQRGKRRSNYTLHNADGDVLLEAKFAEIPGEAILHAPGDESSTVVRLKAWRWFWWNGRYDVVDAQTGLVLATLRRTGGIEGPDRKRIGRVRNPITGKQFFLQGVIIGLLDSILNQGESNTTIPADEFRVEVDRREIGVLRRTPLPFLQATDPKIAPSASRWRKWFARAFAKLARRFNASGWKLDFTMDHSRMLDPRIRLAAALFRIHLERRYNG